MTGSAANPMDAVAVLMKERQRLEEWISQLESRRSITPPHVFERVRGDYEARLREVTQKLAGRTTEVQATSAALTERLARLQSEETAIRDERYEAELRSHVGEITAAEWSAIEKTSDERIAKIASERTSVTAEIARLQQLLAMSAGAPEGRRSGESTVDAPRPASFDELEFLKSVTGGAAAGANGGTGRTSKPVEPPPRASKAIPRSPTPAGSAAADGNGASVPTAPAPRSSGAAPAPNASEVPASLGGGSEGNVIGSVERDVVPEKPPEPVPAFLRDVPQEAAKTLRCHDCGTMNLPTEWYCERCGGELAAM
ncbi:MAG TPA: hypothetical protein VHM30_05805 [Gemmatimonadaceae bacterium]|nr:hypothetical protein [Gemmatimonadaceae bacterium]